MLGDRFFSVRREGSDDPVGVRRKLGNRVVEDDHQVDTDIGFRQDVTLWGVFPHTHVRGKRWNYVLELPDGTKRSGSPILSTSWRRSSCDRSTGTGSPS